ncbi:ThuA domain-containing protein [Clostridium oryzae]|uniref:Trehalose utilization n=1 Tax=Clostridium oryzae TaxID=1450648 RepID=A0A1V4IVC0_9CLOT|nr:ThuA domain-containing protein [Clostridium oryzae]OPJ63734.1 trehalose utilization [Clostridium oryzae]
MKITIWNEFIHENEYEAIHKIYPDGIHNCIKGFLQKEEDFSVRTATLDMPECGLSEEVLNDTDVLIWWAHCAHDKVPDKIAERVKKYVLQGMGFIPLHSAHLCKPLQLLLGTSLCLRWKHGDRELVKCISPSHPIAKGVAEGFALEHEEMYGEYFDIPKPDDVVFIGWFASGEVFRSGCTWSRGRGKIFYFQPGHEEYPIYYDSNIQRVIINAVRWAKPVNHLEKPYDCTEVK